MNSGGDYRFIYQWNPLFPMGDGWPLVIALVLLALIAFWVFTAKRENQKTSIATWSILFRLLPLAVLIAFCLNPERISERRVLQPSEVAVLLDTSLSMNLHDSQVKSEIAESADSRFQQVIQHLRQSEVFQQLQQRQLVTVFGFDDGQSLKELGRMQPSEIQSDEASDQWTSGEDDQLKRQSGQQWQRLKYWLIAGVIGLGLGGLIVVVALLGLTTGTSSTFGGRGFSSHALGLGGVVVCLGLAAVAVGDLIEPSWTLIEKSQALFSRKPPELQVTVEDQLAVSNRENPELSTSEAAGLLDHLSDEVFPDGTESHLGNALRRVMQRYAGRSLASVVIVSDGNQNAGEDPLPIAAGLGQAKIPIQVLAVGNLEPAANAMLVSLDAPAKVLPGSPFVIRGLYRTYHLQSVPLQIELCSVDSRSGQVAEVLQTLDVSGKADGQATAFQFEMNSANVGRTTYLARVVVSGGDFDPNDDSQLVEVAAVERKNRVLLIAGGPSREFRFLRNQLYRDPMTESDVWLQSMQEGADQEADKLLSQFPETEQELDEYDCIVAFDPDWRKLSDQQARDLEQWVSQRGGGLISVAGPVFTPQWSAEPRGTGSVDPVRRLYPVSFFSQGSAQNKVGRFGGEEPFPLQFTRAGLSVDFVSLTSDPLTSRQAWDQFEGVYGYYAVNEAKPGAQVFAYFSDPTTMMGQRQPIYLAAQFVGKGRVFFQASGEMWRIRRLDVNYFQTYYTKLIRWASQGRLLRDSLQGTLVVDKQRCWLGDAVQLEAQLVDGQGQALAWPEVRAMVRSPSGKTESLELVSQTDLPGQYQGRLQLREEGQWRFFLPVPEATDGATLQANVQVQLSELEKRESKRNDALLQELAKLSGGKHLDLNRLKGPDDAKYWLSSVAWRQLERIEPGVVDAEFSRRWLIWMFGLLFTYFCLGWIYRRMIRLA